MDGVGVNNKLVQLGERCVWMRRASHSKVAKVSSEVAIIVAVARRFESATQRHKIEAKDDAAKKVAALDDLDPPPLPALLSQGDWWQKV